MSSATSKESIALEAALSALLTSTTTGGARAREARALSRAADDLEVAAAECSDAATRHALMEQVDAARAAAAEARLQARASAQSVRREELLDGASTPKQYDNETSQAAGLAREINEGLRRATAIVAEEVDRSHAAGNVVDESSRRLRMTRDQHSRYGESLGSGARTLSDIKRSELIANVAVIVCVAFFFFTAAAVASRRVSSSYTATIFVKPAARVVLAPARLVMTMFSVLLEKPDTEDKANLQVPSVDAVASGDEFDGGGPQDVLKESKDGKDIVPPGDHILDTEKSHEENNTEDESLAGRGTGQIGSIDEENDNVSARIGTQRNEGTGRDETDKPRNIETEKTLGEGSALTHEDL